MQDIHHRQTRKQYSAAEKIWILLEGLRGDGTIAELRELLGHVDPDDCTYGYVLAISKQHAHGMEGKIADLRRLERTLN